jgi:pimeloyl-ACP methyl ester carboxylesterase
MQDDTVWSDQPTTWVRSGEAELAVTVVGDGIPLVALHAGVNDRRAWRRCASRWADAGYRTVAYDRRGFGWTRYEAEQHDDLADLRAVTAAADARPAVVVGNSMGGGLAVDLALAAPDDVLSLILIGALPSGAPGEAWVESEAEGAIMQLAMAAEQAGDLDTLNRLETHYWLDGPEQPEGRVQGPARELMLDMNGRALRAQPKGEAVSRPDAWPHLATLDIPTLVIVGEHDERGLVPLSELLVDAMPNATLVRLPSTAHCPSLDQPDALTDVTLTFLSELAR